MNERKIAFLEAALLCSQYADNLREDHPAWADVAEQCSHMLIDESEQITRSYPPGKPIPDSATHSG